VNLQIKPEIGREKGLATLIAKRYEILRALYPEFIGVDISYTLTELRDCLDERVDLGNLSKYVSDLKEKKLIIKQVKHIKLASKTQKIIQSLIEATKPEEEKPWQPQPEEIKLCLEALVAKETEEVRDGFLWDLGSILDSGYWDLQLEAFFTEAFNNPEDFEGEIKELLRARLNKPEKIDVFLKSKREKLYDLAKRPSGISSRAFGAFIDVSEGREVLDKLDAALEGEEAETVFAAAQYHHRSLYEEFGLEFTRILHEALKHERGSVRKIAVETMKEIARNRKAL